MNPSKDITHEITSFTIEDNEEELDVTELSITDQYLGRAEFWWIVYDYNDIFF